MQFVWVDVFSITKCEGGWFLSALSFGLNDWSGHLLRLSYDNGDWEVDICYLPRWHSASGFREPH